MAGASPQTQSYLDVLNEEQLEAVTHSGSPLLILAGAGSGKTRVITTKIAYLIAEKNIDPYQILAVTFTKKAANEMHERAIALDARAQYSQIRTFHSFGAWFLRLNAQAAGIDPNFTVYDDDDCVTLIQKAMPKLTKQQVSHFAHEISLAKDYCYLPDSPKLDEIDSDPEFREVYEAYTKRLRETGNVDFGDLIMLPYLVLHNDEYVRMRLFNRFRVIMVDEYQDSNVAQFLLLQELCGAKYGMAASPENPDGIYVCVVGDDDESIYKFRGAEIQNILTFKDKFPGTKIIRLEKNYRSTEQILSIADDVVRNNEGRLGKTLSAERGQGKQPVLAFLPNQDEEANFCADLIKLAHEHGCPYSDWAILYRTNAQSLTFESTFLHRKIPYQVVGSLKFYEREEIKDILAYLSLLANPRDEIAFRRIVNKPTRGIGATTQEKLIAAARENIVTAADYNLLEACKKSAASLSKKAKEGIEKFTEAFDEFKDKLGIGAARSVAEEVVEPVETSAAAMKAIAGTAESPTATAVAPEKEKLPGEISVKLSELIELISEKSGIKNYHETQDEVSGTQRVANLQELANSAVLYECSREGLLEFLDHIELDRTLENPDEETDDNRVTLITLHNTKGLEFNRVIMTGMELGIFPRQDKTGSDLEEERRLCYVGITRAKNELYMTNCSVRRMYGRTEFMAVSPFLLEIDSEKLKTIGHAPASFRRSSFRGGDYGERGLSHPDTESDPIKKKYSKGTKVFHDDYGYGIISFSEENEEGEYCITVSFENSGKKKFIPKYQSHSLMVIKD
ncbi:MAG: UvrD-helicase domain-containing protein [Treponema sp.]|nr:UvrD-helicase domain-containing protein [Candidatus Treponema equifaecale]